MRILARHVPWILGAILAAAHTGCFGKGFDLSRKDGGGAGSGVSDASTAGTGGAAGPRGSGGTTSLGSVDAPLATDAISLGGSPGTGGVFGTGGATTSGGNGGTQATGGTTVAVSVGGSGGASTAGPTVGGSGGTSTGGKTVPPVGTGGAISSGGKNGTLSTGGVAGAITGSGGITSTGGRGGTVSTGGTIVGSGGVGSGGTTTVAECAGGDHRCSSDNKELFTCTSSGSWPATGLTCPGQCSGTACKCVTQSSANMVPGAGFDAATSDWVSWAAQQGLSASRATVDSSDCSSSGSLLFTATGSSADTYQKYVELESSCVALGSSPSYDMGVWIYAPSGLVGFVAASFETHWYSDAGCLNLTSDSSGTYFVRLSVDVCKSSAACSLKDSSFAVYKALPSDNWVYLHLDGIVPPTGATAVNFNLLVATAAGGGTAKAYFDSLYFAPSPGHF